MIKNISRSVLNSKKGVTFYATRDLNKKIELGTNFLFKTSIKYVKN